MQNNKKIFEDKFSKYIHNKMNIQKQNELFGGQFSSISDNKKKIEETSMFPFSGLKPKNLATNHNYQRQSQEELFSETIRLSQNSKNSVAKQRRSTEQSAFKRKRLRKLRQIEQNVCAICLDQIMKRCQLECKHKFCFDCLQRWFQTSNKCPFCRCQVNSYWFKGEQYFVEKREVEEDFSQYESESGQRSMDFVCYNCDQTNEGDIVLICDRCEVNACHVRCDQRLRGRQPRGDWYCHFCR